jgi:hypothetical protein
MANTETNKESVREAEREHYKGRLWERAQLLLAKEPNHYREPMALEMAITKLWERRDWKPPKWFSNVDRDDALKSACDRARVDFAAGAGTSGNNGAGVAEKHGAGKLPIINRHNRRLRDLVQDGIAALEAMNLREITVFQRAGVLVRIKREDGAARIEVLDPDSLALILDRAANWVIDKGEFPRVTEPPERVVRSMLKLASYDLPDLRGIANAPFYNAAGLLVTGSGYNAESKVYLDPVGPDALDPMPEQPTADAVRIASDYILHDLLGDFTFAEQGDRANTLAMLLTPFVREMIHGPVPLFIINSPQAGTGKSLLAAITHLVATGREAPTGVAQLDQSDAHKAITAILLEARPIVLLDNISRHLMAGEFAAALTADIWTDRVLGQSKMVTVPNRATWIATGNNVTASSELRRRAVEVRLDAQVERPEERTGFRHADLKAWTRENRTALVYSCLLLIRNWIAGGRQKPPMRPLASFIDWSNILGGILGTAGVEGFLANAESFRERADPDANDWRRFVEEWATTYASNPVSVETLVPIAQGLMPDLLGAGNEHSQHSRLGRALAKRRGQIIAGWRIEATEVRDADGRARRGCRLARPAAGSR